MNKLVTIADLTRPEPEVAASMEEISKLSTLYEDFLAADKGNGHTRKPGIHASEVDGCPRRAVYSLMNIERRDPSSNTWKKRFKVGHALHEMLQKDFEQMAKDSKGLIEFESEVAIGPEYQPLAEEYQIESHCDGLFTLRHSAEEEPWARVVLEIKTISPDEYLKLKAPKPEHVRQAHVYMACLDAAAVWFLYWNKGNQNYTGTNNPSFLQRFDPQIMDELKTKFEESHAAASLQKIPERQEGILCEICAFSWYCDPPYLQRRSGVHKPNPRWIVK
jgi:CRISPR/Cas system-associated exonuclease Cas4 (RecB family)